MPVIDLKEQISRLPEQPGVYLWTNAAGETIYVGKARSLRDRVRSYLGAYGLSPRHDALLNDIASVQVIVTDSVVEALALDPDASHVEAVEAAHQGRAALAAEADEDLALELEHLVLGDLTRSAADAADIAAELPRKRACPPYDIRWPPTRSRATHW